MAVVVLGWEAAVPALQSIPYGLYLIIRVPAPKMHHTGVYLTTILSGQCITALAYSSNFLCLFFFYREDLMIP